MQMQTQNYATLTMEQYSELNIRIQKSLILDFDFDAASISAFEDWKIDIEREKFDKEFEQKQRGAHANMQKDQERDYNKETLDYERLSEFFFDLCLSWCQHLDIETFLFFLNGVFLNITTGSHISVSNFKKVENISVLSISFFNTLLRYRNECEDKQDQDYKDWYNWNFKRTSDIVKSVETNLASVFEHKDKRAFDIWMDVPQNNENNYIDSHIKKLDKQLLNMSKINEKADSMTKTITNIETIKRMSAQDGQFVHPKSREFQYEMYPPIRDDVQTQDSHMLKSAMRSGFKHSVASGQDPEDYSQKVKIQNRFERSVINTLPQQYNRAKLIEITETSYLIRNEVRLPIFGQKVHIFERELRKHSSSNLIHHNIRWKKDSRPMTHSTIKEVDEEQKREIEKPKEDNEEIEAHKTEDELLMNEPIDTKKYQPEDPIVSGEPQDEEESLGRIDVKVPRPGDYEYDRIQDQNQAIKKLIINIDNIIKSYDSDPNAIDSVGGIENFIKTEIEKEGLLSDNEKKTIEVLVIDYLRNEKSVLDLIRLDKLEEDLRSQDDLEEEKQTIIDSEDRKNVDILWKLPESEQYEELLTQIVPNKYERINEIKYKIPNKWTKKFNVDDIVPHKEKLQSAIVDEGGMVNNYLKLRKKISKKKKNQTATEKLSDNIDKQTMNAKDMQSREKKIMSQDDDQRVSDSHDGTTVIQPRKNILLSEEDVKSSARYNETDGFNEMSKKPIFTNQDGIMNVPLSNMMLKESLSSKQDSPKNQTLQGNAFPKPGLAKETKTLLQKQKDHVSNDEFDLSPPHKQKLEEIAKPDVMGDRSLKDVHPDIMSDEEDNANVTDHEIILEKNKQMDFEYDKHPESPRTEAQYDEKSGEMIDIQQRLDYSNIKPQFKPPKYNIEEIEHLFMDDKVPNEIHNIEDPMEYNYLLVKLKKEFNDKTRSEFLKYMNLQLPYNSRRDEVGGVISEDDWQDFISRVQKMIRKVRRKRRRIIRRRKKRGKTLMPRKTLFKPRKRPNLAKDPLWKEIFLNDDSEDSTVEESQLFEDEKFKVPEAKPKKKFFENKEKFELPPLYQPLVKESKKPTKHE